MSLPAILLITAAAALLAWPALRFAYYVLGPAVDDHLGILMRRDLDAFKRYEVDGKPLGSLIEERLGPGKWHARHGEFIFATDIDCRPLAGGIARWEINRVAPREWLPAQPLWFMLPTWGAVTPTMAKPLPWTP